MKAFLLWDDSKFEEADDCRYGILQYELIRDSDGILKWKNDSGWNYRNRAWGSSFLEIFKRIGLTGDEPVLHYISDQGWEGSSWRVGATCQLDDIDNMKPISYYLASYTNE